MPKNTKGLIKYKKGDPRASEAGKKSKRGKSFKTLIDEIFVKESKKGKKGKLTLENYLKTIIMNGMKGNAALVTLVINRYFGQLSDKVELTGKDGEPIKSESELKPPTVAQWKKIRKEMLKEDDL